MKLMTCMLGASVLFGGAAAMAQTACEPYTIQPGDTLRAINIRAYGNDGYRALFEANRAVIGEDPNLIEVGAVLDIPCPPGSSETVAVAPPPPPAPEPAPEPQPEPAPEPEPVPEPEPAPAEPAPAPAETAPVDVAPDIRFVTYDGNAPYSGADLPNGGLATELLETAYSNVVPDAAIEVTVAPNLSGFLRAMGSERYDVGFPSIRPDCNVIETLTVEMIELCAKYAFSQPFHEIQMTAWTLDGSPYAGAAEPAALSGSRICRPAGLFTFDLEADRLPGRGGTLTAPADAAACFAALAAGETDVVSLPRNDAQRAIAGAGLAGRVVPVAALERGVTLHAVANQSNPAGVAAISRLNRGLEAMRADGTWFRIVARQLSGG